MFEDIADRRTVGLGFVDCPREKGSGERALRRVRLVGHSSQSLGVLPVKEDVDPTGFVDGAPFPNARMLSEP